MMLRRTAMALREEWQRKNVGLQKPKGLGERRMERENTMDFFLGGGGLRFFFCFFFKIFLLLFFYIILILFNLM
jgi:hypothetical protein